jgi:hypothetical protein
MVLIVKTTWAGLQGGPGITQMALDTDPPGNFIDAAQAQTIVNAVRTFWVDINNEIPNDVTLTVQPSIDSFATTNGELGSTITAATPPTAVTGASVSSYSAASGARIKLATSGIKNNRRVRGAIFLVPLSSNAYDNNGSVASSIGTQVAAAYATLNTALDGVGVSLGVWSRPSEVLVTSDGTWYPVTGVSVNSKVAVLRGRRD